MENIRDHSETAISLMWSGSASGEMLPPMVIYRAANLYEGWTRNGIRGSHYRTTSRGWFDSETLVHGRVSSLRQRSTRRKDFIWRQLGKSI